MYQSDAPMDQSASKDFCPPAIPEVGHQACAATNCSSDSECDTDCRCCFNGCTYTCLPEIKPPIGMNFKWLTIVLKTNIVHDITFVKLLVYVGDTYLMISTQRRTKIVSKSFPVQHSNYYIKRLNSIQTTWIPLIISVLFSPLMSICSPNQIAVYFGNLNFYFIKTANIPVYGNIAVDIK